MSGLVLFGAGQIADLARFYFEHDSPHRVAAFVVDGAFLKETSLGGLPVIALEDLPTAFSATDHAAFVAVSYARMNALREQKCAELTQAGYNLASYVSSRATTFNDLSHGPNCFILEDNTVQPFVRIGAGVTLWSGNHIGHHSVIEDNVFVSSHVVISGGVTVGANSFLGVNCTIRDHVRLGKRCLISAGALITADVEDESVMVAPPAEKSRVPSSRLRRI